MHTHHHCASEWNANDDEREIINILREVDCDRSEETKHGLENDDDDDEMDANRRWRKIL